MRQRRRLAAAGRGGHDGVPHVVAAHHAGGARAHLAELVRDVMEREHGKIRAELGWEPDGLVEKAGAALGFDQRQVDSSAKDFKQFIESRGAETGAWRGDVS